MPDQEARTRDLVKKAAIMLKFERNSRPEEPRTIHMVTLSEALVAFEGMHPEEAVEFVRDNWETISSTKVADDVARIMGYERADDPRRKADTAKFWTELERRYSEDQDA